MDDILAIIEEALRRKGYSASAASQLAVGNPALIKNLKNRRTDRERSHPIDNLRSLAEVLDLEFYFGPPRDRGPVPPAASKEVFVNVPLYDAGLSAGNGQINSTEDVVDYLAFRQDWLRKIGVAPSNVVLARASGESMTPTIWPDDIILIDTSRKEIPVTVPHGTSRRRSLIYAILENGEAKVKRVERPRENQVFLVSDNPEFQTELADLNSLTVIGKVLWWGHTNREW